MFKEKSRFIPLVAVVVFAALVLSACTKEGSDSKNNNGADSSNFGLTECYNQCEEWGGDVDMCKENCDASNDKDSVWNQSDEDVAADNDSTFDSWESMPLVVPNFTTGDFVAGEEGMGSWIVDFENVTDDNAMSDYVEELEVYGWKASYMSATNMINGTKEGYTIMVNMDSDSNTVQIIVRETD